MDSYIPNTRSNYLKVFSYFVTRFTPLMQIKSWWTDGWTWLFFFQEFFYVLCRCFSEGKYFYGRNWWSKWNGIRSRWNGIYRLRCVIERLQSLSYIIYQMDNIKPFLTELYLDLILNYYRFYGNFSTLETYLYICPKLDTKNKFIYSHRFWRLTEI